MLYLKCFLLPGVSSAIRNWFQEYLGSDPVKAYGQYAFESDFKLGMSLAVALLEANMPAR